MRGIVRLRGEGANGASTFYILDVSAAPQRLTQVPHPRRSTLALLGVLACVAILAPSAVAAADPLAPIGAPHAGNRVLITWAAGAGLGARADALSAVRTVSSRRVSPAAGAPFSLTLPRGLSVELAIKRLSGMAGVASVEPDYLMTTDDTSNDPQFTGGNQWDMYGAASSPSNEYGSGAADAWAAGYTGSRSVFVGVIDEGIQFSHPDLTANIWTNPYDPVDGVDNDGNGYVDDVHGWDFFNNDSTVYDGNSFAGYDSHGTHVSGTIGAVGGNGTGIAGINWQVTIVSAKFLGPNGGWVSDAIRALDYLTDLHTRHGLDIVATNNSWGGGTADPDLQAAIERAGDAGMLFVAAAGNSSADNDATAAFPSNLTCTEHADGTPRGYDCVIAVAAIDKYGALSYFSDYGATTVDLGAPGSAVLSTVPVNTYASWDGTSMATPHVTGALALCASIGGLRGGDLRAALMGSVAPTSSLAGKTVSGGRLDIGAMVDLCAPPTAPVSGGPGDLTATVVGQISVRLEWTNGAQNETAFDIQGAPDAGGTCGTFATLVQASANATSYEVGGLTPGTDYCFRTRAINSYQGGSASDWSNTATATTNALSDTLAPSAASPSATLAAPQALGSLATVHLAWEPSADASGIASYDLQYSKAGGTWTTVGLGSPTATSADFGVTPGKSYAFRLRAHDGVGNVGAWATTSLRVNLLQEGAAAITYTGTFKRSNVSGASGGHVRQTGVGGRVATLTFSGANVGFVSTLGPARGIVAVWLDGVLQTTLDLYAPMLKTKRVVWSTATGAGVHTLQIRVTGTRNGASTSSRADVDAFLLQP